MFHPLPIDQIPTGDGTLEEVTVVCGVPGLFDFGLEFVPQDCTLQVRGWIIDRTKRPCSSVWLCVDGQRPVCAASDVASPDIAKDYGSSELEHCAFEGEVPIFDIEFGPHTLEVIGTTNEGRQVRLSKPTPFYVVAPTWPIEPHFPGTQYGFRAVIETFETRQTAGLPKRSRTFRRSLGSFVRIGGWAADVAGKYPVGAVFVRVGQRFYRSGYGNLRFDVAAAFGNPSLAQCGFDAIFSTHALEPGVQNISIIVASKDGTCVGSFRPDWTLELYESAPNWALSSKLTHESLPGRIDEITWQTDGSLLASDLLLGSAPLDATVNVTGWIASDTSRPPGGAFIETTHGRRIAAQLGGSAGGALGGLEARRERFRATIDAKTLGLGTHALHLCVIGANRRTLYPTHAVRELRIVARLKKIAALVAVDMRFINRDVARARGRLRRVNILTVRRPIPVNSEKTS